MLLETSKTNCGQCPNKDCIHRNAFRRQPREIGGLGLCPNLRLKKFKVTVQEQLSRDIEIEAPDEETALAKTWAMYQDEKIVLDSSDYHDETNIFMTRSEKA